MERLYLSDAIEHCGYDCRGGYFARPEVTSAMLSNQTGTGGAEAGEILLLATCCLPRVSLGLTSQQLAAVQMIQKQTVMMERTTRLAVMLR